VREAILDRGIIRLRRRKIDSTEEDNLVTNLITSTEFCKEILPLLRKEVFHESAREIYSWIDEFFKRYHKAPQKDIQSVYDRKSINFKEESADLINKYLSRLSIDYEQKENYSLKYELDSALLYIRRRNAEVTTNESKALLDRNELVRAEDVLKSYFRLSSMFGSTLNNITTVMTDADNLLKEKIESPPVIIYPWLMDGQISMIYAQRGVGKTWLALLLAVAVSRKKAMGTKIGPWRVVNRSGVLYVDGEMGLYYLQNRMKMLSDYYGEGDTDTPLTLLTAAKYVEKYGTELNFTKMESRQALYEYLAERDKYQLLILDNVSSLMPGIPENSKEDWDPINQWLIALRHLHVSVIIVHHAGKGNTQRGTSGREDALDCILKMGKAVDFGGSAYGAKFSIFFEKARNVPQDKGMAKFNLMISDEDGKIDIISDADT